MSTRSDLDRSITTWLIGQAPEQAPQRLVDVSRDRIRTTRQRRAWWPAWRFPVMNAYAKLAIGLAAVAVIAVVGFNLLPTTGAPVGGPTATPSLSPSAPTSSSPSPASRPLPTGDLDAERYRTNSQGVPFTFALPSARWRSPARDGIETGINTGSAPSGPDFAWITFSGVRNVATDPCAGEAASVNGPTVDDLAAALSTIPGTTAEGPEDVTIGGLPGKLVTLTIDPDPPCAMNQFWLYGDGSLYPNSANSIIRIWITEVDGQRWAIHSDQGGVNQEIDREIRQIIDSIEFE